jgi:hypothetical protein
VAECGSTGCAAKITYERVDGQKIWEQMFFAGHGAIPRPPERIIGTYVVKLEWQEERSNYA